MRKRRGRSSKEEAREEARQVERIRRAIAREGLEGYMASPQRIGKVVEELRKLFGEIDGEG